MFKTDCAQAVDSYYRTQNLLVTGLIFHTLSINWSQWNRRQYA